MLAGVNGVYNDQFFFIGRTVILERLKWQDAIDLEIDPIKEYEVFQDLGPATWDRGKLQNAHKNHQKIKIPLVFAVKQ